MDFLLLYFYTFLLLNNWISKNGFSKIHVTEKSSLFSRARLRDELMRPIRTNSFL